VFLMFATGAVVHCQEIATKRSQDHSALKVLLSKLHLSLTSSSSASSSLHSPSSPKIPPDFSTFKPASESAISIILFNCPNKQCDSDPISTWLLKECSALLVPTITNIVNLSLSSGKFHHTLKESVISCLLKKPTLDKDELSNYRPISNLSLISKIIERVVKSRISDHLTSNNLVNPHQSAYCKHHSTEIALLYIHDHLINATSSQKILISTFLIYRPPLIPLTTISYLPVLVYPLALAFMALH